MSGTPEIARRSNAGVWSTDVENEGGGGGGGSQSVKHEVVGIDFSDIDAATGFADVYLLPESETVLASWPVVTTVFDGTSSGFTFTSAQLTGPSGSGSGPVGDTFDATQTNASNADDGLIGPDPSTGLPSAVLRMLPIVAPVPGGGSVQLVIDFPGGGGAVTVPGATGHVDYHLVIAVAP